MSTGQHNRPHRASTLLLILIGLPLTLVAADRVVRVALDSALLLVALVVSPGDESRPRARTARTARRRTWAAYRTERARARSAAKKHALAHGFAVEDARYHAMAEARHRIQARRHLRRWLWLVTGGRFSG